jgi:hypothetical protein
VAFLHNGPLLVMNLATGESAPFPGALPADLWETTYDAAQGHLLVMTHSPTWDPGSAYIYELPL